jgi:hypothetical protein
VTNLSEFGTDDWFARYGQQALRRLLVTDQPAASVLGKSEFHGE